MAEEAARKSIVDLLGSVTSLQRLLTAPAPPAAAAAGVQAQLNNLISTCISQLARLDADARACTVPIDEETLAYISAPGDSHPDLLLQHQLTALIEMKAQLDARSDAFSELAQALVQGGLVPQPALPEPATSATAAAGAVTPSAPPNTA